MDTTVVPPPNVLDAAIRPCSLQSLGSVLSRQFCPECDRDLGEDRSSTVVLCETCCDW